MKPEYVFFLLLYGGLVYFYGWLRYREGKREAASDIVQLIMKNKTGIGFWNDLMIYLGTRPEKLDSPSNEDE